MSAPEERGSMLRRRRRPDEAEAVEPVPTAAAPSAPVAPSAPATPATPAHRPLDLAALAEAATLSRGELDALMSAFVPRERATAWRRGQRLRARVSRVTASTVFLDVGGKADAAMDRVELPEGAAVGEVVDCFVLSTQDGELRLTRTLGGDATRDMLDEAKENAIPVQGKVVSRNDHGFEVQLSGGVRAFCPASQIDHSPEADLDAYLGRSLSFRILDVRGREAIVSHRVIAEEEARSAQGRLLTEVKEGEVYPGVVTSLREFGAFVRLPSGVEGLVHLSNIGKARLSHPKEALTEGQEVNVKVLSVDLPRQRLNLGIRQAQETGATMAAAPVDRAQLSSGTNTLGTFAGLLSGVKVSAPKAKAAPAPKKR